MIVTNTLNTASLRSLDLKLRQRILGRSEGEFAGLRVGNGFELGDARRYEPGDDVRRIDWAITARTNSTHVRDVIADHELSISLLIDLRPRVQLGTRVQTKASLALLTAAGFTFMFAQGANVMSVYGLIPGKDQRYQPTTGSTATLANLSRLEQAQLRAMPQPGQVALPTTELGTAITRMARLNSSRSLVIIFSDFFAPIETWARPLRMLGVKHEVMCVQLQDPIDFTLPNVGVMAFTSPETTDSFTLDTSSPRLRAEYEATSALRQQRITQTIARANATHMPMLTTDDITRNIIVAIQQRNNRTLFARSN